VLVFGLLRLKAVPPAASITVNGVPDWNVVMPLRTQCESAAETKPLLEDFKLWLEARLGEVSQKSGLAEAIRYALSHWEGLTRFLSDGRIEIDSNTVERTMRPIGLGRRNYLFAGSDEGGRTWAIIASLINSAKLIGIDPQEYLTDVLERIVSGRTKINQLEELLPWRWKAARQVTTVKAAA